MEVYSENEESRVIRLVEGIATRGQPSANNFWWHALDLRVSAGPAQVSKVEACVSLDVIDLFVQGFDDNKVKNTITGDIELGGSVMNSSTLFCETEGGVVEGVVEFLMEARSVADETAITGASFYITSLPTNELKYNDTQKVSSDQSIALLYGQYTVVMEAKGYITQNQTMDVGASSPSQRIFFMIPTSKDSSYMYVALRWPQSPISLDLTVMPLGMDPTWVDATNQPIGDPRSIARAYAGQNMSTISWYNDSTAKTQTTIRVERYEATHGLGEINGPQVISIETPIPGQYRVYVDIPPLASCVIPTSQRLDGSVDPVFQEGDEIYVDIYISDKLQQSIKMDKSGGKWWFVGYFFVSTEPVPPVWVNTNQIVLQDPLTLFYGMIQIIIVDAVSLSDYSDTQYTAYIGGLCKCTMDTPNCVCFGNIPASGLIGPDVTPCGEVCEDAEWTQGPANALYLPQDRSLYMIQVTKPGYVDRVGYADAYMDSFLRIVMVPLPRPGELRIVLSWGQVPLDLDLWAIPVGDINDYTYWDSKGPHNGVRLDTDCTTGYGPESITFTAGTLVGTYRVAVNVYTYDGNAKCTGMNRCQFVGGETVEFFESRGIVKISTMDPVRPGSSWWLAGVVQMLRRTQGR